MELLKIGKRTYAAGLDAWLSVETHTKAVKVARKKAKSLKFAVFALRPSPVPQIGLLKEFPKGRLKGQVYSLAAAVAGAQPESWSGLFALPSGKWWVLSIFNGVIVSNGDLLTADIFSQVFACRLLYAFALTYSNHPMRLHLFYGSRHYREATAEQTDLCNIGFNIRVMDVILDYQELILANQSREVAHFCRHARLHLISARDHITLQSSANCRQAAK